VAHGGTVVRPDIPGIDSERVCTFEDVLRCRNAACEYWPKGGKPAPAAVGDTVLIWGDHYGAVDCAEKLGMEGRNVIVVTENKEFGLWVEPCHRDVMFKRFKGGQGEGLTSKTFAHPVTIIPDSTILEIGRDGAVVLIDGRFERSTITVDSVVLANVTSDDSLYQGYRAAGLLVARIGDAKKVRNLRGAVTDGADIGLTLDRELRANANGALIANLPAELRGGKTPAEKRS
jgi:hypothetical protein